MLTKLHDFWRQAENYQKFLYLIGTMLLISAVFHSVVLIATGDPNPKNCTKRMLRISQREVL